VRERDEELGVFVHNVEVWRAGQGWAVREALAIEPMPRTPRWRFWWFNHDTAGDTRTRLHLVDHWAWYAAVAGFPPRLAGGWIAGYGGVALALLLAGLVLGLRSLPSGAPRLVRRRRKRRSGVAAPASARRRASP
jgi:hypothetical protein